MSAAVEVPYIPGAAYRFPLLRGLFKKGYLMELWIIVISTSTFEGRH